VFTFGLAGLDDDLARGLGIGDAPFGFDPFDILRALGECFNLLAGESL